jgi:hypothetical protein
MAIAELFHRTIISGTEGCGKSSQVFEFLKDKATHESPVLFGVKNYTLMEEQIENWSSRYDVPLDHFAICGWYTKYERANEAYTNSNIPFLLGDNTRFVFTTQAQIQRNRHKEFVYRKEDKTHLVNWQYIVIDEFEYTNGLIPTLDYYFSKLNEFSGTNELKQLKRQKFEWIAQNYTISDMRDIQIKQTFSQVGFTVAHWIKDTKCPLIFLTSEILAKELLLSLPEAELGSERFKELEISSPNFKNCVVHTCASPYVNKELFNQFGEDCVWNKLGFDFIISDNINSWYEKPENLKIVRFTNAVSHMGVKGSNNFRDKKILTVLSHIPDYKIKQIQDTFNYFEKDYDFTQVKNLFYRDRVCQAVGRVLGNRGSTETHLLIHSNLLNALKDDTFPYSFNADWTLNFDTCEEVFSKIEEKTNNFKRFEKEKRARREIVSFAMLDDYFVKSSDRVILPVSEVKDYIKQHDIKGISGKGKNTIPVSKVAKYFDAEVKNKKIDGKTVRCLIGVSFKNA